MRTVVLSRVHINLKPRDKTTKMPVKGENGQQKNQRHGSREAGMAAGP